MDTLTAILIAEGNFEEAGIDTSAPEAVDTLVEAWQYLIDTGLVWKLQGTFGRMAEALIANGTCHAAA